MTINNYKRNLDADRRPLTGRNPVGTRIGPVVFGLAGEGLAEAIDPTRARACRSEDFSGRDSFKNGSSSDDYGPAYGFGMNARGRYPGRNFDDVESEMSSDWAASRGGSILSWDWAKHAARDGWNRLSRSSSLCA